MVDRYLRIQVENNYLRQNKIRGEKDGYKTMNEIR